MVERDGWRTWTDHPLMSFFPTGKDGDHLYLQKHIFAHQSPAQRSAGHRRNKILLQHRQHLLIKLRVRYMNRTLDDLLKRSAGFLKDGLDVLHRLARVFTRISDVALFARPPPRLAGHEN